MAAAITLAPLDDRGREILDELQRQLDVAWEDLHDGARKYTLLQSQATVNAFDAPLDRIAPDWREHVANVTPGG